MRKIAFLATLIASFTFTSCGSSALTPEESTKFNNECMAQAIATVGEDKIDMVMPDYKDKCKCYSRTIFETEVPFEAAMKLLEDKFDVFAKLQDISCK